MSSFSISAVHYDTLHLSRIDPLTLRSGEHPPDSHSVPPKIKGGIDLDVTDPGKGSQRRATSWVYHFRKGNEPERVFEVNFAGGVGMGELDFDTEYSWSVVPANEFGLGPAASTSFHTDKQPSPPPPPPPPPPPTLDVSRSKLSLFNCVHDAIFIWLREAASASGIPGQWTTYAAAPHRSLMISTIHPE